MNWKIVLLVITIVFLLITGITTLYFQSALDQKESQITNLKLQVNSKTSEINNIKAQIAQKISEVDTLNSQINDLKSQIDNLQNDVTYGESEIVRLNNIIENLKDEASQRNNETYNLEEQNRNLESQVASLNYQINNSNNELYELKSPKLVNVGLGANDNREDPNETFLEIEGSIVNVGRETAYNCKLQIVAYQADAQKIFILNLPSGTIEGLASVTFKSKIFYAGGPLSMSRLTMTPEWTDTP